MQTAPPPSLAGHPPWTSFHRLPRAYGPPLGPGRLRVAPSDFVVDEDLGFEPDGAGEHLLLWVRKTDQNTEWVAQRLAETAGIPRGEAGYAGLKDRRAVTTQWFSLPRPRGRDPDWSGLATEGIEVLRVQAHRRKLRRGALAGNRFRIRIRDWEVSAEQLAARLATIRTKGIPNYFGEQRFGHREGNLLKADAFFRGTIRRPTRHQQGLWLSAARSQIFNELLAERVRRTDWDHPLPGDCLNLNGTRSYFCTDSVQEDLDERARGLDIHPTGPLWGRGETPSMGLVRALETGIADRYGNWVAGLARAGMAHERRPLRLGVSGLAWEGAPGDWELTFWLRAGGYATAVLRELVDWVDISTAA